MGSYPRPMGHEMPVQTEHRAVFGWGNPVEQPAYLIKEAAYYLRLPAGTVRDWVFGRKYPTAAGVRRTKPLIQPADPVKRLLSFQNLVELHVIASVRRVELLELKAVRRAIDYLREKFQSKHPLLDRKMLTDGQSLFIEHYGELVNISESGQMYLKAAMEAHLKRIKWDEKHTPIRLFPFSRDEVDGAPQMVVIDPRIRFGRPCITGTNVPTSIILERHLAGESVVMLAKDYGRSTEEIEEALRYEVRTAA
jgi:uncharacterized protein (DUF433 family)